MTSTASSAPETGLLLTLNGAEDRLQIALGQLDPGGGGRLLLAQEAAAPFQSMQFLAPAIRAGLASLGREPRDISRLACVRGPGNFTGLRITLATVLGLQKALCVPAAGVDYLPLLARGAGLLATGVVWVLTHARRRLVHVQGFAIDVRGGEPEPLGPPAAVDLETASSRMLAGPAGPRFALGSGLRRNEEFFSQALGQAVEFAPPELDRVPVDLLFGASLRAAPSHSPIEPYYLRPSDAEENLDAIALKRGLDPAEARARLVRLTS